MVAEIIHAFLALQSFSPPFFWEKSASEIGFVTSRSNELLSILTIPNNKPTSVYRPVHFTNRSAPPPLEMGGMQTKHRGFQPAASFGSLVFSEQNLVLFRGRDVVQHHKAVVGQRRQNPRVRRAPGEGVHAFLVLVEHSHLNAS